MYFRLFTLSQMKTNCAPLPTTPENVTALSCRMTTFSSDWRYVAFLQTLVALKNPGCGLALMAPKKWKEPVVMCGKWNVKQPTSQQMFKLTTFCTDIYFQSFSLLINCSVHHAVLKFSPCRNKMLPQLVRIADWYSIREKMKKMKNLCILQGSAVTFFRWVG